MLTLLETAAQVRWFVHSNPEGIHSRLLAITPEAAYACQQLGKTYLKLEDHADVSKLSAEYDAVLARYLEWECWLDNWAQEAIPEFGASGFKPASGVTFLLQLLFAEIWAATLSLREFLEAVQPAQVAFWSPVIVDIPWHLHPQVASLPALLPSIAHAYRIPVEDLSAQVPDLAPASQSAIVPTGRDQPARALKRQLLQQASMIRFVAMRDLGLLACIRQFISAHPRVLLSGFGYDLVPLVRELCRQGARLTLLSDALPPARLRKDVPMSAKFREAIFSTGRQLVEEPGLWRPLEEWGLEHISLWSKPLAFWWHHVVPELWLHFQRVRRLLGRQKFAALVTWDTTGSSLSSAAANAAAVAKVPRYVYQHGSSSGSDARLWQMYLRHSETFLAYGKGTVEELHRTSPQYLKPCGQAVPVGSTRLDVIRNRHRPDKADQLRARLQAGDTRPLIMYVPASFNGYGRAIGDLRHYPDVSYFELQQTILKLWIEAPGVRLLYKELVVANDPNRTMSDFIRTHIPNAIITNLRLTDLMWAVDAIVVDHVITAVGEVLLTSKPLVFYMPGLLTSQPHARAILQKRAFVAEAPSEFVYQVQALLHKGHYSELGDPNREFLRTYCTHLDDGRSAERAASTILARVRSEARGRANAQ